MNNNKPLDLFYLIILTIMTLAMGVIIFSLKGVLESIGNSFILSVAAIMVLLVIITRLWFKWFKTYKNRKVS